MAFKDDVLATLASSRETLKRSNLFKRWARDNPGENTKMEAYWLSGGTPPSLATDFGKAQVKHGEAYWMIKNTSIIVGQPLKTISSVAAGVGGVASLTARPTIISSTPQGNYQDYRGLNFFANSDQWAFQDQSFYPWTSVVSLRGDKTTELSQIKAYYGSQANTNRMRVLVYKDWYTRSYVNYGETNYANIALWNPAGSPATANVTAASRAQYINCVPTQEVKWHDANVPSDTWQLYDNRGHPIVYPGWPGQWFVNPASPSYKAYYLQRLRECTSWFHQQGYILDGHFFDNISTNYGYSSVDGRITRLGLGSTTSGPDYYGGFYKYVNGVLTPVFQTMAQWRDALIGWARDVLLPWAQTGSIALHGGRNGYYCYVNTQGYQMSDPVSYPQSENLWTAGIGQYADLMMKETGIFTGAPAPYTSDGSYPGGGWEYWADDLNATARANGCSIALGAGDHNSLAYLMYQLMSVRVNWDGTIPGQMAYVSQSAYPLSTYSSVLKFDWGTTPLGARQDSGWMRARRWPNGWAVININDTSSETRTFTDPATGTPRTFTLPARCGAIYGPTGTLVVSGGSV